MSTRGTHTAARVATLLAVLSVLVTVGAGATAGVVMVRGDGPDGSGTLVRGEGDSPDPPPSHDYSGWEVVTGPPGDSGEAVTYRVPRSTWEVYAPDYAVAFRDSSGKKIASGHAPANYYGNRCADSGKEMAGGWTVLDDDQPSGGLGERAEAALRPWAEGYAADDAGNLLPVSRPTTEEVTLPDGTPAGRSTISVDMSSSEGACLPDSAEIMATTIDTADGPQTLVQARYLESSGISDEEWLQIADSLGQ